MSIDPKHLQDLRNSTLTDETITKYGIVSLDEASVRVKLGRNDIVDGGWRIQYPDSTLYNIKLDTPTPNAKGKPCKYLFPAKASMDLFRTFLACEKKQDISVPYYFCEGEKKAMALEQLGYAAIAIPGVWNWRSKKSADGILPAMHDLNLKGRPCRIVFDSDKNDKGKKGVLLAEQELAYLLNSKGAEVGIINLDPKFGKGVDDQIKLLKEDEILQRLNSPENFDDYIARVGAKPQAKQKTSKLGLLVEFFDNDSELRNLFQFNEFSEEVEYTRSNVVNTSAKKGTPREDKDISLMRIFLARKYKIDYTDQHLNDIAVETALRASYNPVVEFLTSLPKWDGVPRLDTWLTDYAGVVKTSYTQSVGAKVLIAAVRRAFEPGTKFDHMLVLEGTQGIGKSTLVKTLGGEWYSPLNFKEAPKDAVHNIQGQWIIEVEEMAGLSKRDIESVKSFISASFDRVRLSYARTSKNFQRRIVLIGTLNPDGAGQYLQDQSGNRRFWPVKCNKIDIAGLKANLEQLWAEALIRHKAGEKIYLTAEMEKAAISEQGDRTAENIFLGKIAKLMDEKITIAKNSNDSEVQFSTLEIANFLGIQPREMNHSIETKIGQAMRSLKFMKARITVGNVRYWVYRKTVNEYVLDVDELKKITDEELQK